MRTLLLLAFAAAAAAPAAAQVEVVPFGGYRFGGSLDTDGDRVGLEARDGAAWGASLAVQVAEDGEIEALFSRQDTRLETAGLFTGTPRFDLEIETWQLGGNYLLGADADRVRPYVGAGLGVSRLVPGPADLQTETRFAASVAAGVKAYVNRHLGFRAEVRAFFTVLESDERVFCDAPGGCDVRSSGSDLSQAEARAGLILRF